MGKWILIGIAAYLVLQKTSDTGSGAGITGYPTGGAPTPAIPTRGPTVYTIPPDPVSPVRWCDPLTGLCA